MCVWLCSDGEFFLQLSVDHVWDSAHCCNFCAAYSVYCLIMFEFRSCDMDAKCRDDQSALHLATIHCQVSAVAALLRHNALDACVDSFG